MQQKRNTVLRLTESAVMIALATVLSEIQIVNMPFGGTVTAFSMLPVLIIAYRYGLGWGLFTGAVDGVLQMLLGMGNLKYGTSAFAVIIIVLFDYLIAFGVLGLGGIFRNKIKNQGLALASGSLLACVLRYLCHCVSGYFVWYIWAWEGFSPAAYSFAYNATYMVPETIITVIGALLISLVLDFKNTDITRRTRIKESEGKLERNNAAAAAKIMGVAVTLVGVLRGIFLVINEFLASEEPNIPKDQVITSLFVSVAAGIVLYAFGEGVQALCDLRSLKRQEKK